LRILGIQGLRGVAVLLVLLGHFGPWLPNGYIGVDVFFVISGFVITKHITSKLARKEFGLREFYVGRFKRLFLPLAVTVLVTIVFGLLLQSPRAFEETSFTGFASLIGVSNGVIHVQTGDYFAASAFANALTHTWSLAVEEQFYLFFPLLFIVFRSTTQRALSLLGKIAICVASAVSLAAFFAHPLFVGVSGWGAVFSYYSPVIRAWEFGAGALLFLYLNGRPGGSFLRRTTSFVSPLYLLMLAFLAAMPGLNSAFAKVAVIILAVVLALALVTESTNDSNVGNRLLTSEPLLWLGDRSYSIYLVHWPILVMFGNLTGWLGEAWISLTGLAVSLMLGHLSFLFLEKGKVHVLMVRRPIRVGGLAAVLTVVGVVGASLLYPSQNSVASSAEVERNLSAPTCHSEESWCIEDRALRDGEPLSRPIYLIGDSAAQMFYWGLKSASDDLSRSLVSRTHSGCPGFDEDAGFGAQSQGCTLYQKEIRAFLAKAEPGLVVIGFTDEYVHRGDMGTDYSSASQALLQAVLKYERELSGLGHQVLVIQPIPNLNWGGGQISLDLYVIRNSDLEVVVRKPQQNPFAEAWVTNSKFFESFFETNSTLCHLGNCNLIEKGVFVWRDNVHMTKYASLKFEEQWREYLQATVR